MFSHISPKIAEVVVAHLPAASPEIDPSTNSNYLSFDIQHTAFDWDVSFTTKTLSGSVTHTLAAKTAVNSIRLDTSYLNVTAVSVNGATVPFTIGARTEPLGAPLTVQYAAQPAEKLSLRLEYATTAECTALQWLEPEQTDGGEFPYLFSQCQAIHARSLFPCFDTPAVKVPLSYKIVSPYPVLASGLRVEAGLTSSTLELAAVAKSESSVYHFNQPIPVPSYLVAISSGDLVSATIGPRSLVYSEPSTISSCQHEFCADTESFISTAEKLIFPYEWSQYNILVLVSSFPYGGMENPNITFATPTLISGDRQNVDVIAHELAHSWSGNLVTNASWEHFWLNEGWTVYIERRIVGAIHGEAHRHFSAIIGWEALVNSIKSMGVSANRFSTMVQDLKDGTDPDDSFSSVPYEKGFNLLYHIETVLGGPQVFDAFIPHYFNKFSKKSLDTYEFLDTLYEFFADKRDLLDTIDWNTWLYGAGLPPKPKFDTTLVDQCYALADRWTAAANSAKTEAQLREEFSPEDITEFSANQNVVFLDTLSSQQATGAADWASVQGQLVLRTLSGIYSEYAVSKNAEVVFRYSRLAVTGKLSEYYPTLANWLGTVGRMKFVRPGFSLLNSVDRELALKTFAKFEGGYHPICKGMVKKDLGL
ncbi:hypothetical protein BABINDRAFT_6659 [Babjeviella inositovora NRRL Y-12698]|uniref:Leukotriene A(4) hydrolase n=1 Tax=Babjeviella inositovora NRRL Y-12698 TaxID=984486 RepID=A0A1E3QWK8_9ASCO|nr:uncharacterized protein BABINDRAFT_6659 [Babjeviella inositovora NRRL Y-12698]ODQ82046.1 hypothetical protein BABINDRAFT_6659 [Babjeviella inositovora NRRL Y-12698]